MKRSGSRVDLLALTAELIDIPSVSHSEGALADRVEEWFRPLDWLVVDRVGDNVVARTFLGRPRRLGLVGHLDTVPPNGNERARVEGERVYGLGACDMKGGLAVMLALGASVPEPSVDVSYVFYAREEVARELSGLLEVDAYDSDLLAADAVVLGEPSGADLEAGCQGTMHLRAVLRGERAHTARPWMGKNAVHRLAGLLAALDRYEARRPVIDGCEFREALVASSVSGGTARNVVPDEAVLEINHRFAPDRSPAEAEAHVRDLLGVCLEEGNELDVLEAVRGAPPGLEHPLLASLVEAVGGTSRVRAKLGWTDAAFFAERGVAAVNFGPGDSELAHTAGEYVSVGALERVYGVLADRLTGG